MTINNIQSFLCASVLNLLKCPAKEEKFSQNLLLLVFFSNWQLFSPSQETSTEYTTFDAYDNDYSDKAVTSSGLDDEETINTSLDEATTVPSLGRLKSATAAPSVIGGRDATVAPSVIGGRDATAPPSVIGGQDATAAPSVIGGRDATAAPSVVGGRDPLQGRLAVNTPERLADNQLTVPRFVLVKQSWICRHVSVCLRGKNIEQPFTAESW